LLKVGLPSERGNTPECRRKFFMGCREPPPSPHKGRSPCHICYMANPALDSA